MAQRARVKRRASAPRDAHRSLAPRVTAWVGRVGPDLAGFALLALSLITGLAVLRPEGAIAQPIGHAMTGFLGWLGLLVPLWLCVLSILVLTRRSPAREWPWPRLAAAGVGCLALLGLAALEGVGAEAWASQSSGGGMVGRVLAVALVRSFGVPSTVGVLLLTGVGALLILTGLRPPQLLRAATPGLGWTRDCVSKSAARLHQLIGRGTSADRAGRSVAPDAVVPGTGRIVLGHDDSVVDATQTAVEPGTPPKIVQLPLPRRGGDGRWRPPPLSMLQNRRPTERPAGELREQARIIEETLASFNVQARVVEANQGPAVTQFGIEPAIGVPVSRITARANDLALRLGSSPIRMEAPVPGRRMVGLEVPNGSISVVTLREVLEATAEARASARVPIALGKDIAGKSHIGDLARMPHLLIAGATGSGKSVCINSLVASLLVHFTPDQLQLLMIDPKQVELISFNGVPHLRMPVVTDMDKVVGTLKWAIQEMERRYKLFAKHSARNLDSYNRGALQRGERPLPFLVVIIDELADLMMTAPDEAEKAICRLAQLARATGIHLVIATQRPSVDVVTGLIKANFPTRIAFAVTSQVDSRVILDMTGAERLLGRGDMLYVPPDASQPARLQGTYVSDQEIDALAEYWRRLGSPQYDESDLAEVENLGRPAESPGDDLYERAVELAQETSRISVSLLQRRLGIGYPRAARLMDVLESRGVVISSDDGKSWKVLETEDSRPPWD